MITTFEMKTAAFTFCKPTRSLFSILFLSLLCLHLQASAQEDLIGDPFGEAVAPTPRVEVTEATDEADEAPVEANPAVRIITESNPQSPRELTQAIAFLARMDRPQLVRRYCGQLLSQNLDQATFSALHRRFGSGLFLELIRNADFQPEGAPLGSAVMKAAEAAQKAPERIAGLIAALGTDPTRRYSAIVDLSQAGDTATSALIAALASSQDAAQLEGVHAALVGIGTRSIDPLLATFQSGDEGLHAKAIHSLGMIGDTKPLAYLFVPFFASEDGPATVAARDALLRIVGEVPTRGDGVNYLRNAVRSHLSSASLRGQQADGQQTIWRWDENQRSVAPIQSSRELAELELAARKARQLYQLDGDDPESQRLYFATLLESAQRQAGLDTMLDLATGTVADRAAKLGTGHVEDLLAYAIGEGYSAAALAAINVLGEIGDAGLLLSNSGRPSTLAAALQHPNRRIRFAAAMAIGRLDPRGAYPGSSYFPKTLAYFLRSVGSPRALIVHPRIDRAQSLVGLLAQLGFEADVAQRSAQAQLRARQHPDYEFVLVSDAIDRPHVDEFIQRLRRDTRTRHMPVGVIARQQLFERMRRVVETDPLAETFPRPHDLPSLSVATRRLLDRGAPHRVPYAIRVRQAIQALELLNRLSSDSLRYAHYDLMRHQDAVEHVLYNTQFAEGAVDILGRFGSAGAQRALLSIASRNAGELQLREAAAAAFDVAVRSRGVLLTRDEILQQYDRYNQSAVLDRGTQQVLGSLLDSIEARTRSTPDAGS